MAVHGARRTAPSGSTPTEFPWAHPDDCETYGKDLLTGASSRNPPSTAR